MAESSGKPYHEAFEALKHIYLEDSWVLSVVRGGDFVRFDLEAVLTPEHPRYGPNKPGEQHCYERCELVVSGIVRFDLAGVRPTIDPDGSAEIGNIDAFYEAGSVGHWVVEGDWGILEAHNPVVTVRTIG